MYIPLVVLRMVGALFLSRNGSSRATGVPSIDDLDTGDIWDIGACEGHLPTICVFPQNTPPPALTLHGSFFTAFRLSTARYPNAPTQLPLHAPPISINDCRDGRTGGRTARYDDNPSELASLVTSHFSRSTRERSLLLQLGPEGSSAPQEALNEKAVNVIRRVQDKLAGLDFGNNEPYDVNKQVDLLIQSVCISCSSYPSCCLVAVALVL